MLEGGGEKFKDNFYVLNGAECTSGPRAMRSPPEKMRSTKINSAGSAYQISPTPLSKAS